MERVEYTDLITGEKYVVTAKHGPLNTLIQMWVNDEYIGSQSWIGGHDMKAFEKSITNEPDKWKLTKSVNDK